MKKKMIKLTNEEREFLYKLCIETFKFLVSVGEACNNVNINNSNVLEALVHKLNKENDIDLSEYVV